jgi:hypothetical protein
LLAYSHAAIPMISNDAVPPNGEEYVATGPFGSSIQNFKG